jgi:hypothetical protein
MRIYTFFLLLDLVIVCTLSIFIVIKYNKIRSELEVEQKTKQTHIHLDEQSADQRIKVVE